jgi:hypothetical protein
VLCEGVLHRLRFRLDHLSCVKLAASQFYVPSKKQRNVGCVEKGSHVVFGETFPGERGNVIQCAVLMLQPASFDAKVRGEVFEHFHAVTANVTVVYGIECLAWQDEFFVNNPLDIKENDEHAIDVAFPPSRLFWSRRVWTFRVWLMLSSPSACLITVGISAALLPRFAQNLMIASCRIHREIA